MLYKVYFLGPSANLVTSGLLNGISSGYSFEW